MARPTRAIIDLAALRHNALLARRLAPHCRLMAMVKADAYGHGAVPVARRLEGLVDGFGVAFLEEALELRREGIEDRIVLLEGFFSPAELPEISANRLDTVVHSPEQLATLLDAPDSGPHRVWLKMDSGMHRLGLEPERFADALAALRQARHVAEVVLASHLACADQDDPRPTDRQLERFRNYAGSLGGEVSLANSAALLTRPDAHRDWLRLGLVLYGLSPLARPVSAAAELHPVMRLASEIVAVRSIDRGEAVGYGGRWVCSAPTRVGVVPIGYADGYPRHAADGTPVLVGGERTRLIGRVSMDLITVDLTEVPGARVGSSVELWGPSLSASEVAAACGTISYELLAALTRRVPRHTTTEGASDE